MLCGARFHRNLPGGIRIRNDATLLSGLLGTCGMAKRRELTEQFGNGVQFGTCSHVVGTIDVHHYFQTMSSPMAL